MAHWTDTKATKLTLDGGDAADEILDPYIHWLHSQELLPDNSGPSNAESFGFERLFHRAQTGSPSTAEQTPEHEAELRAHFGAGMLVPMHKKSVNTNKRPWKDSDVTAHLPDLPKGEKTVIVGIVDTGVSLSHHRFRDADGKTRFIASWQQGADFDPARPELPFGHEVYCDGIQDALDRHSAGAWIDEDAFNRELQLVAPQDPYGQRDLDHPNAHGTHVLDLAAGHHPRTDAENALARQQRLIAVNLPAQSVHGTSGTFLAYFAIFAIKRILFLADALWAKNHPSAGGPVGYPVVINFSYGLQAGPKDGSYIFEKLLSGILEKRNAAGKSPVRIVLPAGNDNLERAQASSFLGKAGETHPRLPRISTDQAVELDWRLLPGDTTPNYLEIWARAVTNEVTFADIAKHLKLFVTPPGGSAPLPVAIAKPGGFSDLKVPHPSGSGDLTIARLYTQKPSKSYTDSTRFRRQGFLLCALPTDARGAAKQSPAGAWKIKAHYDGPEPLDFEFYTQSDQSAVRSSKTALRSYLDHPDYDTHVQTKRSERNTAKVPHGGVRDSYHYTRNPAKLDAENWLHFGPIQRRGTVNALASQGNESILCVGGHDELTGRPALYSGTSNGNPNGIEGRREYISLSFPSENATHHFGLIAAGGRDGSVTTIRGTSMSTALATRHIVDAFCEELSKPKPDLAAVGTEKSLTRQAKEAESASNRRANLDNWEQPNPWPSAHELKVGSGRLPVPASYAASRVNRLNTP